MHEYEFTFASLIKLPIHFQQHSNKTANDCFFKRPLQTFPYRVAVDRLQITSWNKSNRAGLRAHFPPVSVMLLDKCKLFSFTNGQSPFAFPLVRVQRPVHVIIWERTKKNIASKVNGQLAAILKESLPISNCVTNQGKVLFSTGGCGCHVGLYRQC